MTWSGFRGEKAAGRETECISFTAGPRCWPDACLQTKIRENHVRLTIGKRSTRREDEHRKCCHVTLSNHISLPFFLLKPCDYR